jgi:hypothetical protein
MDTVTAFLDNQCVARGAPVDVAMAIAAHRGDRSPHDFQVFDDHTGRPIDLDSSGSEAAIRRRYAPPASLTRPRGRPRLGVIAREVTLLPRHWEWLGQQRGGASAALRALVDEARRRDEASGAGARRRAQDAAYRFLLEMGGDRPGYEEALRALFAGDLLRFAAQLAEWPPDVRAHAEWLATPRVEPRPE